MFFLKGLVLHNASMQLNNAELQINSINVNPIYDDIAEAVEQIDKATVAAKNLETHGIYLSRSYQTYVTLAKRLAFQLGKQDCYLNYTCSVPEDIYSTACEHIKSAVCSYLQNLKAINEDLIRLKVLVTENSPSSQFPILQSCWSRQTACSQAVKDGLQSYVYSYKVFIMNITAQVMSHLNQLTYAEQSPYFAALRNNIDESVAMAAYHVKIYTEEVLYCAGLSPRAQYEQSLNKISNSTSMYNDIINLQQKVINEINYA